MTDGSSRSRGRPPASATSGGSSTRSPTTRRSTDLVHHASILDAVENLIGPNIQLHHTKLNLKPPASGQARFEWHQDYPFFPHSNYDLIAVAVHIDESTEENGCLRVIPGIHKRGPQEHMFSADGAFSSQLRDQSVIPDESHWLNVTSPAGGVEMHHCNMLHSSTANRGTKPRSAMIIQYRAADNVQLSPGLAGRSPGYGMLVRGVQPVQGAPARRHDRAAPDADQGPDPARRLTGWAARARRPVRRLRPAAVAGHHLEQPVVRQGVSGDPVAPDHRLGRDERVDDRLLGRLDDAVEQRVDDAGRRPPGRRAPAAPGRRSPRSAARLPVAKARNRSPLVWPPVPPARAMPEPGALGEPLALVGQQRRIGRDDDDDRARAGRQADGADVAARARRTGSGPRRCAISAPTGHAVDPEPVALAVVRLDQDADRVAAELRRR